MVDTASSSRPNRSVLFENAGHCAMFDCGAMFDRGM
jgi:hypothetical protein